MSLTQNPMSYHDLGSLQQIRSAAGKDEKAALRQAAEQFESIFFGMLLGSMRKANEAFEVDGMMNSQSTKFYRDMHDSQLATELSSSGALGLADLLVQQLSPALSGRSRPQAENQSLTPVKPDALSLPAYRPKAVHVKPIVKPQETPELANNVESVAQASPQTDWQVDSPLEFVKKLLPAARKSAAALGLDPLALVAQAALETGWGQRMIKTASGSNSFNLFGIKASNGWQGDTAVVSTLEYRQGLAMKEQARFRAYASPQHSLTDYVDFIRDNPRYQNAVNAGGDVQRYFEQLQAAGYATDPAYAEKIMAVYQSPVLQQACSGSGSSQEFTNSAD